MVQDHPLKAFRNSHSPKLSQGKLAKLLGVQRTTVARWETRAQNVDRKLLPKISEATGIAPSDLRPDLAELLKAGSDQ